jgi:hypothetical protein
MASLPLGGEQQRTAVVNAFATGDRTGIGELSAPLRRAILDVGAPVFTDGMQIALTVAALGALVGAICATILFRGPAGSTPKTSA